MVILIRRSSRKRKCNRMLSIRKDERYFRPQTLTEAAAILSERSATILAGGTDFYPAHATKPLPSPILDVTAIAELRGLSATGDGWRIGGGTTWAEIASARLPRAFRAFQQAALQVGSVQIQNRGTVAGNLCNASPAADGIPPLLLLNATVELTSAHSARRLPLSAFLTGYRKTERRADEILSALIIPHQAERAVSSFVKLGARTYLVISIVMAAVLIENGADGILKDVRIAVGSASVVAQRLTQLEHDLLKAGRAEAISSIIAPDHFSSLNPIDDVRATADYRMQAILQTVIDAVMEAAAA
jgi:CO/xanthine dehydrogenase FAD-binding subunit